MVTSMSIAIWYSIKMKDFSRKACGVRPYDPYTRCLYSLQCVMREIHIALTMMALHDVEVKALDVLNAWVLTPNKDMDSTRPRVW